MPTRGVSGGGVWMDSGYHSAYLCVSLLGSPVSSVAARVGTYASDLPVDDTAVAQLVHANGSVSSVQVAWSVPSGGQRVLEVYGTEGSILLDHEGHSLGVYSNATQTWHYQDVMTGHADSFNGLYHAVYECLRFGAPPPGEPSRRAPYPGGRHRRLSRQRGEYRGANTRTRRLWRDS